MFLILIGIFSFLLMIYFKHKYSYWEKRGLKTPPAYPIVGTILSESKLPPMETEIKFLKELGPCFGTYFGVSPVFNTSRIEDIKTVLSDLRTFPNESSINFNDRYLANSIFFKSGQDWKLGRSAQTHYFTSRKFRNLLCHFEQCSKNLLENIEIRKKEINSDDLDVKSISKNYGLDVIAKVLFAIDVDSYKESNTKFVKSAMSLGDLNPFQSLLMTILPKKVSNALSLNAFVNEPINELGDYFKKMIRERRKNGIKYNDLSELLQDAVDDNKVKMNEDQVIGNILLAFFAGIEPVSNATSQALYFLSRFRDVQDKLYDDIVKEFSEEITYEKITQHPYLDAFLNESLRLGNNIFLQTRTAAVDTKLGEHKIDKGTEIRLITSIPHRDSNNFKDPDCFNPDRWLKNSENGEKTDQLFIPFGMGHKMCLGMRLALLEAKFLIVRILQNYVLSEPEDNKVEKVYFRGFQALTKIKVKFEKRV